MGDAVDSETYQGAWVRRHRELLGFTQGELAEAVREDGGRLSRSHLANIEAGMYGASSELIRSIAQLRGLDVRDTWRHVGTLPRTRHERGPSLHQVSQVDDSAAVPSPARADTLSQQPIPGPHAPATALLDWARATLAGLARDQQPDSVVLTTVGPLAAALRAAPPPGGILGGLLGSGIRAVLDSGAELRHVLAVPADPEAHFNVLAEALPLAARYFLPPSPSRPCLSRYDLTLAGDSPAGPDVIADASSSGASMLTPIVISGHPGTAVVDVTSRGGDQAAGPQPGWAATYASWLAAHGTGLFSWVTVIPAGTLSMPLQLWEERLTQAWESPGGRDSIQRMLSLSVMSEDLRAQLVTAETRRRHRAAGTSVTAELRNRIGMHQTRRRAMIRNLENGYRYRNIVTREALDDLVIHGQYTMERLADNVLTVEQIARYLQATIDLIRTYPNFEVLILTDQQLEQALPLGVSWIVKRSPQPHSTHPGPAWAFLPYTHAGEAMAMNVVVNDHLAIEGICQRIDALWSIWAEGRTGEQIRNETISELKTIRENVRTTRPTEP